MRVSFYAHIGLLIVLGLAWQIASSVGGLDPDLLPPISSIGAALASLLTDSSFLMQCRITAFRVMLAIIAAVPVAFSIGFFAGEYARFGKIVNPVIHLGLAVPQSIFLPIFMLLFGIDTLQKVVFGFTHAFFVMTVITMAAVRSVPPAYAFAAHSFGANSLQIHTRVLFPAMAPILIGGLRIALIFDIIGVLGAEMYGSRDGLGTLIFRWGEDLQVARLGSVLLMVSLFTVVINEALRAIEIRIEHWKVSA